jgi:hypothetical protein
VYGEITEAKLVWNLVLVHRLGDLED